MKDIKNLKPRKGGHYKQGYFDVTNSTKYLEIGIPVIYRSGLEYRFFNMLEKSNGVTGWCGEPTFIKIPYFFKGKERTYNIDCYVEFKSGKKQIIEIKPFAQTQVPEFSKYSKEIQFHKDLETYQRNVAKWKAAFEFAQKNNMEFKIITEKTIDKYL